MKRTASARWIGTLKDGKGTLTAPGGVLSSTPYSFATRFGDAPGTNPEELIAAAQALEFHAPLAPAPATAAAMRAVRRLVPRLEADRSLAPDIAALATPGGLESVVDAVAAALGKSLGS